MAEPPLTEHTVTHASGARTFYLASGPSSGKLMIFCHGWPELSHSWRHQLVFSTDTLSGNILMSIHYCVTQYTDGVTKTIDQNLEEL